MLPAHRAESCGLAYVSGPRVWPIMGPSFFCAVLWGRQKERPGSAPGMNVCLSGRAHFPASCKQATEWGGAANPDEGRGCGPNR
ncbi:MAG: hypothetical protein WCY82_10825 [Desulfotomaculaceae bacterium]